jgi:hypothetical protein
MIGVDLSVLIDIFRIGIRELRIFNVENELLRISTILYVRLVRLVNRKRIQRLFVRCVIVLIDIFRIGIRELRIFNVENERLRISTILYVRLVRLVNTNPTVV